MKNLFKDLPGWSKGVIIIIILLVVVLIAWKVYKFVSDGRGGSDKEDVKDAQKDLNDLIKNGVKPTMSQAQFSGYATSLREAFDGCGTDNKVWENVFKAMKNEADVLALIATYGTRTYDGCNWEGDWTDKTSGLPGAINAELSSSEIGKLNASLSSKGINYQF